VRTVACHASIVEFLYHTFKLVFEVEPHVNKVAEVFIRATTMMCKNGAPSTNSGGWSIQGIFSALLIAAFASILGHDIVG
jgi:hypothetical protein